jgi:hypothetical protein
MENLTISDVMALRRDDEHGYRRHYGYGTAATGLALGASGLAVALFGGAALWAGLNSAGKARSEGAYNTMNAQAKANADLVALLASRVTEESNRANTINIDVAQTLRNLTGATATGGQSSAQSQALATAEALALINQQNTNPLSSVIQNACSLRVTRVAEQNCGCGCNG